MTAVEILCSPPEPPHSRPLSKSSAKRSVLMNFGFGVGDVLTVTTLAWNVYKMCKYSPGVYKTISGEVVSLHIVLRETDDLIAEETTHDGDAAARLNQISIGCKEVLDDLQGLLDKYNSLGTQAQRTWDRMEFGMEDIATIRSRLIAHAEMLNAFNSAVTRSSQKRMEKKLEKFMAEVRAGLREGSVISTHTAHTVEQMDEDDLWLGLRRELEDVGISPQLLSQKKEFIVSWIKTAIAEGTLEEVPNNNDEEAVSAGLSPTTPSKRNSFPRLLSARRFLGTILQDDKKFLAVAAIGNVAIVMEQLNSGIDKEVKDKEGRTALCIAAQNGHEKVVKVLLDGGVEKEARENSGWTALHLAAENGHEKVVKVLLDGGAEKEAKNQYDWTALHIAAEHGHEEVVKVLLDGGAEKEAKGENGWTALHLAAQNGHETVVKVLLDSGAQKEAKAKDSWTALHIAAENGHEKVVKVLLDSGIEKEARGNSGWTALHLAAANGHEKVVKALLDSRAEKEAKDNDGFTALQIAVQNGRETVAQILLGIDENKEFSGI